MTLVWWRCMDRDLFNLQNYLKIDLKEVINNLPVWPVRILMPMLMCKMYWFFKSLIVNNRVTDIGKYKKRQSNDFFFMHNTYLFRIKTVKHLIKCINMQFLNWKFQENHKAWHKTGHKYSDLLQGFSVPSLQVCPSTLYMVWFISKGWQESICPQSPLFQSVIISKVSLWRMLSAA